MNLILPSIILNLAKQRGLNLDPKLRGSEADLAATCAAQNYVLHPSVCAFEAEFGGLMMPEDGNKLKKDEPHWLFGAHACLNSDWHAAPRGGGKARNLVPVVYAPNDVIYFLDANGKAFAQDTIEDPSAVAFAKDGMALMCRIILNDALYSREETTIELPGLQGEAHASRLALALIAEASGKDYKYYGDARGQILAVEDIKAKKTRFACASKALLEQVSAPAVAPVVKLSAELAAKIRPFLGKDYLRLSADQVALVPDIFDHLPDLRELDLSMIRLMELPESLWRAKGLTSLDISFNAFKTLPDGIGNLKNLRKLILRGCPIQSLPEALAGAKNLTKLSLTECEELDVDAALLVIAKLPKINDLSLPLSVSLTNLAPLAKLPLKSLLLSGARVKHADRLPLGLGQLQKLTDLRIEYADDVAHLSDKQEDVQMLRLLFNKKFTDADIRLSAQRQPEKLYLQAFAATL